MVKGAPHHGEMIEVETAFGCVSGVARPGDDREAKLFFGTHVARLEAVAGSGGPEPGSRGHQNDARDGACVFSAQIRRRPTAQRGANLGDVAEVEFPQGAEMDQNKDIGGVHPVRAA